MNNLKVSTRLTLGFGAIILIGIAISIIGALKMRSLAASLDDVASNRMVKVAQFTEIKDNLNAAARAVRNIVISDAPAVRDDEKKKIAELRSANKETLAKLEKTLTQPKALEYLKILNDNRIPYNSGLDRVIALVEKGEKAEAVQLLTGEVRSLQNVVFKASEDSRALQKEVADMLTQEAAKTANTSGVLMSGLALLMLIVGAGIAWLITRDLSRSLGAEPSELCDAVSRVADGDLSVRMTVRNGDTASVVAAVERMQTSLTRVVGTVRQGSESVATASMQIAQGNNDLSGRTEEQASALEETAASMEQLSSTVRQNADNAKQANQLAQSASTVAIQGGEVVAQVVGTMKGINDSSRKISDIISVIDGIAFQTNILALNAAVEAARAGEQGRGFAVVASEVRSLAGRSADAAKEIKTLINDSVERVEQGTVLVDQAGTTMAEVVSSIRRVTDIMGEISAASNEQAQGVAQVGEAITQMDQATQQNAALVEESAAAADSLKTQAQQLVQAVAVFKLAQDQGGLAVHSTPVQPQRTLAKTAQAPRKLGNVSQAKPIVNSAKKLTLTASVQTGKADGGDWESF
ncbi:MAG: methyl-accepting chemotaxis protein [Rhodoferax sp.]|uniref:methyl-accepting chemotaxis protein n=1 Tax=Rhodoferax sp. TaxID=50421 RepID=UPI0017D265F9|nr:methyl-accepting chemotaxis protein [Rhodoferax sp.]NMM13354.1 methyl-accepting chemotaxis protein [Rhodoferax sp.]